jgi:hypothetical protein
VLPQTGSKLSAGIATRSRSRAASGPLEQLRARGWVSGVSEGAILEVGVHSSSNACVVTHPVAINCMALVETRVSPHRSGKIAALHNEAVTRPRRRVGNQERIP